MIVYALHPVYGFGTELEIWYGPDNVLYVGAHWSIGFGRLSTYANVPAETVTVGTVSA